MTAWCYVKTERVRLGMTIPKQSQKKEKVRVIVYMEGSIKIDEVSGFVVFVMLSSC